LEITLHPERFAVVKTDKIPNEFFAVIKFDDFTVVVPEGIVNELKPKEVERGFRLITFNVKLPFNAVGFISKISKALAEANIPILVFSSYHTDHILVKDELVERAIETLRSIGFKVRRGDAI